MIISHGNLRFRASAIIVLNYQLSFEVMGWLNQLRHKLRYGAQSLLAVLDSDSENETDLDTTCVQIPSYHGVLNNLTPLPTRSHTTEEENQVADQLMTRSEPNSPKKPGQGVKEVPFHELHDHVPVYQQGKIVSYRDISPQWEQHKTQQVLVTNQDGNLSERLQEKVKGCNKIWSSEEGVG
ncbi:hypothetical protein K435DRAFT_798141 [Dendrothele bispora CBS 962.96]|uniref:Uncharacterized protein n=1 Tax=Dendrothele bispora (strain CBS 962.96) TaxID=1314807 RepID=A0A4S8M081_DENBC|nr:hypothetical protein K435DRAFT_798141 [Dendrothele bispora CBS 962.96]